MSILNDLLELLGRPWEAKVTKNHCFSYVLLEVALFQQVRLLVALGVEKGAQSGPESDPGAHQIRTENHIDFEIGKNERKRGIRTLALHFQWPK